MHAIRWNRKDRARLGMAVARFNKIAEKHGLQTYNYADVKGKILSRKELERKIKIIKSLTEENASTYEEDVRKQEKKLAERTLKRLMKKADKGDFMIKSEYGVLEGELSNIRNLNKLSPSFRAKKLERISELARADYEMMTSDNYRNWYIKSLEDYYSEFDGYEELMKKLKNIRNPQIFYNRIRNNENAADIFYMRYNRATQEFFNKILEAWGLNTDEREYEDEGEVFG